MVYVVYKPQFACKTSRQLWHLLLRFSSREKVSHLFLPNKPGVCRTLLLRFSSCLGLARAKRCLTCFCLISLVYPRIVTVILKNGSQIVVCKPQSLLFFAQISNSEAL